MISCFATTVRGLEQLLADELSSLGASQINVVNAGLEFSAELDDIMQINLHSRLASRIMIRLAYSGYRDEKDIYRLAKKIEWDKWFHIGNTIKVSTNAMRCPLKSLDFVTLTVKDAICDYFVEQVDARPDVNKVDTDMRIYTFLTEDSATIYLDTSGDTLFKRGYRRLKPEAPIRENLAFGLIKLSGWTPDRPFYDPMCGSGTIAVEAISYGLNIAPGLNRNFAFEKFLGFDDDKFNKMKEDAKKAIRKDIKLQIFASDINRTAIEIAKQNFQQINLDKYVEFSYGDFVKKRAPAKNGVLITNPPYGVRLAELDSLAELYPQIASNLKQNFAGWDCYFFTGDLRMPKLLRLKPSKKTPLYNGALECRLYEFKMVSGSNR
ncbi:MAG: class I SAM-dependent RNA methyltransferase [Burkholderiales bacterium]|nr:class I SAM-dependent RNA methyltransferase [Burkholderiales bacterium]